jgi:hypothetical protein
MFLFMLSPDENGTMYFHCNEIILGLVFRVSIHSLDSMFSHLQHGILGSV